MALECGEHSGSDGAVDQRAPCSSSAPSPNSASLATMAFFSSDFSSYSRVGEQRASEKKRKFSRLVAIVATAHTHVRSASYDGSAAAFFILFPSFFSPAKHQTSLTLVEDGQSGKANARSQVEAPRWTLLRRLVRLAWGASRRSEISFESSAWHRRKALSEKG